MLKIAMRQNRTKIRGRKRERERRKGETKCKQANIQRQKRYINLWGKLTKTARRKSLRSAKKESQAATILSLYMVHISLISSDVISGGAKQ